MKLTKAIRNAIVESVMAATTFPERKASIKKRTSDLARQLLMARVPMEFAMLVNGSPAEWFACTVQVLLRDALSPMCVFGDGDWRRVYVEFDGFSHPYDFNNGFSTEEQERFFGPLRAEAEKLAAQMERTENELRGFLASVTTTEKLIERMPELKPHIPTTAFAKSYPVVASTVNLQNYLASSGFDTTNPN